MLSVDVEVGLSTKYWGLDAGSGSSTKRIPCLEDLSAKLFGIRYPNTSLMANEFLPTYGIIGL
jgi:hypothetical protein